jgi:glucose/arabinose dehydrogenase
MQRPVVIGTITLALTACAGQGQSNRDAPSGPTIAAEAVFDIQGYGTFREPWAMSFLPGGTIVLSERAGVLRLVEPGSGDGAPRVTPVSGVPEVDYGGQGGLGDVVPHPDFAENRMLYLSYAESGEGDTRGAAVARGTLVCGGTEACRLEGVEVIWRQSPKTSGRGHYGHRIAFSPDGHLFISSGDRQKQDPAQDTANTLGTLVRLNDDGSLPTDNPFADSENALTRQIWSFGHRNPLGLAFAPDGRLWEIEHGPAGGDEVNLVEAGVNYGWPTVSNGRHYGGLPIPDHDTRPDLRAPAISWTPVIAPGDLLAYSGEMFPEWRGDLFAAGMQFRGLVHLEVVGDGVREIARYDLDRPIRSVRQAADGAIWILEDERDGNGPGELLRLTPAG